VRIRFAPRGPKRRRDRESGAGRQSADEEAAAGKGREVDGHGYFRRLELGGRQVRSAKWEVRSAKSPAHGRPSRTSHFPLPTSHFEPEVTLIFACLSPAECESLWPDWSSRKWKPTRRDP